MHQAVAWIAVAEQSVTGNNKLGYLKCFVTRKQKTNSYGDIFGFCWYYPK